MITFIVAVILVSFFSLFITLLLCYLMFLSVLLHMLSNYIYDRRTDRRYGFYLSDIYKSEGGKIYLNIMTVL